MMGTGLTSLHFYLYEPVSQSSFVLPSLFVSILFFDLLYVLLVANRYKKNNIPILKI
jgi:hypothetical protein